MEMKTQSESSLASTVKQILDTVGEGIGLIASPSTFWMVFLTTSMGLNTGFDGYVTNLPAPVYIDTYVETYQTVKIYYNSANYYWAESVSLQGIRYLTLQQAEQGIAALIPPIQQPPSGSGYIGKPTDPAAVAAAAQIINSAATSELINYMANTVPTVGDQMWNWQENYVQTWDGTQWVFQGWLYEPSTAQQIADIERQMAYNLTNPALTGQNRYLRMRLNTLLGTAHH